MVVRRWDCSWERCAVARRREVTQKQPYRVDSWLFRSPLKCSNFFSVSSLKEPPEGWASGRQSLATRGSGPALAVAVGLRGPGDPTLSRWPAGATSL